MEIFSVARLIRYMSFCMYIPLIAKSASDHTQWVFVRACLCARGRLHAILQSVYVLVVANSRILNKISEVKTLF
jgi:hypothetical protein